MGNSASLNWGAILHSIQSTDKHAKDAKANKNRAGEVLIRVDVPQLRVIQEQAEAFKDHRADFPNGLEYICRAREVMVGTWKVNCVPSDPDEYKAHLLRLRNERNFYWAKVQRTGEKKARRVKRPVKGESLHELTIMHAPWQMALIKTLPTKQVRELLDKEFRALMAEHHRLSGRDPVGGTIHFDSGILHHNLHSCRVSEDHDLMGHARLNTAGPWAVGANRQRELGCTLSEKNDKRLDASLKRHAERLEKKQRETTPLDIALTRKMDEVFDDWIAGKDLKVDYEKCKADYRQWHEENKGQRKMRKDIQRLPSMCAEFCIQVLLEALIPEEVLQGVRQLISYARIVDDLVDPESKGAQFLRCLRVAGGSGGTAKRIFREILPRL